jgi:hypothetical protein
LNGIDHRQIGSEPITYTCSAVLSSSFPAGSDMPREDTGHELAIDEGGDTSPCRI